MLGALVTIACLLPLFLTGALASLLMEDLEFGSAALGVAVAMSRGAGAALSPFLGRLVDQLGATRSIRVAAIGAAVASIGIATTADRWGILVAWLMVSGSFQALGQPGANRLLARTTSPERLGFAFGLKQSAPPAATMLAGLSVPLLALTLGWRWTFVAAALVAIMVAIITGPGAPGRTGRVMPSRGVKVERRRILLLLAIAFGLGTAASSAITTFYVDSAVRAGSNPSFAAMLLAVASVAAMGSRIAAGAISDRLSRGHLRLCATMLTAGAIGLVLLATDDPSLMAAGAVIATTGVWGFNGVFWYALIRGYPEFPGQITGTLAPGALLGATFGPAIFGWLAEATSFQVTWSAAAGVALVSAVAMLVGNRHLPAPKPPPIS